MPTLRPAGRYCPPYPRHRLLPQPYGFEGFGVVQVVLLADHVATAQREDARPFLGERESAGLTATGDHSKRHEPVAEVDEFGCFDAEIAAPNFRPFRHEVAEARRPAIGGLRESGRDELAWRMELAVRVVADKGRVQIATVQRLRRKSEASPYGRVAEARMGRQPTYQASVGANQSREAKQDPLVERAPRWLAHAERLSNDLLATLLRRRLLRQPGGFEGLGAFREALKTDYLAPTEGPEREVMDFGRNAAGRSHAALAHPH
jgi:hypothetical protein